MQDLPQLAFSATHEVVVRLTHDPRQQEGELPWLMTRRNEGFCRHCYRWGSGNGEGGDCGYCHFLENGVKDDTMRPEYMMLSDVLLKSIMVFSADEGHSLSFGMWDAQVPRPDCSPPWSLDLVLGVVRSDGRALYYLIGVEEPGSEASEDAEASVLVQAVKMIQATHSGCGPEVHCLRWNPVGGDLSVCIAHILKQFMNTCVGFCEAPAGSGEQPAEDVRSSLFLNCYTVEGGWENRSVQNTHNHLLSALPGTYAPHHLAFWAPQKAPTPPPPLEELLMYS